MTAAIELSDLQVRYGAVHALRGLTLAIPTVVIYGVLGPNGSCKTTAIRAIAGLLRPHRGTARVLGQSGRPSRGPCARGLHAAGAGHL